MSNCFFCAKFYPNNTQFVAYIVTWVSDQLLSFIVRALGGVIYNYIIPNRVVLTPSFFQNL